jgi:hypothetical protein
MQLKEQWENVGEAARVDLDDLKNKTKRVAVELEMLKVVLCSSPRLFLSRTQNSLELSISSTVHVVLSSSSHVSCCSYFDTRVCVCVSTR